MSEYRIIQNALGFIPQRRYWYGWDALTGTGSWWGGVVRPFNLIENARDLIDSDIEKRRHSKSMNDGVVVEYRSATNLS